MGSAEPVGDGLTEQKWHEIKDLMGVGKTLRQVEDAWNGSPTLQGMARIINEQHPGAQSYKKMELEAEDVPPKRITPQMQELFDRYFRSKDL